MKRFTILLTIIMCISLTGYQLDNVKRENIKVSATITKMQYNDYRIIFLPQYNPALKTTLLIAHTFHAQYLITITYKDISETFDDQTLYKSVKKEDTIQMILRKDYDEDNNLIKQTLHFPE